MKLYLVTRTDDVDYLSHESPALVVREKSPEAALRLVCGGPNSEFPDIPTLADRPVPGFKMDQSNAAVEELTGDGPAGIIVS